MAGICDQCGDMANNLAQHRRIPLMKDQEDIAVLFMLPPDPLHINLLGCGNTCLEYLEKYISPNIGYNVSENIY